MGLIDDGDVRRPDIFPRITPRYQIPPLRATWHAPSRRRIGGRTHATEVRLVDISIAGALLIAPANSKLETGSRLKIEFGDTDGIAEIRNVRDSEHDGFSYYGINYFRMSDEMRQLVHGVVAKIRAENDLTTSWERRDF